ncbi:cell wall hydrolase [[Clostridium] sordellii]|uniref:Cell wall hydrolase n=1 Tax=Paraclostridium sordellii TaxID=1505 RepID=A0ABP1XWG5_PARSO|nr:NlpC/P60 family protein [Paeniclostridium sordellii]CEJ75170.1 putative cell wall hydrolase [[Clostridium] sordellii] [Paeniclostridium sordellii]CEN70939.1 cell wall hydrolase [[Clostridium] sordellii] [Paeniclostridium sordellii]CEN74230.1 cell wall hydrolase [[Clostridium] sordellii] [Paeniclostridium sordellii]CEP65810.1 cell wall hydrolase [[Clostridium] sordellii] [Paeniclostridium sordellii]
MKRKILVPVFASFMALSMNGIAHADDAKTEKATDKKDANDKNIINLSNFKDMEYKVAVVKDDVAVKVREQGSVQTIAYSGEEFKIIGEQDGWYKVQLNDGNEGWIASRYVDVKGADAYVTAENVNLRKDAHIESDVQDNLGLSTKVEVLGTQDNWVKVKNGDKEGFIRDLYVSDKAPEVEKEQTDANDQKDVQDKTEETDKTTTDKITTEETDKATTEETDKATTEETDKATTEETDKTTTDKINSDVVNNNNNDTDVEKPVQKPVEKPAEKPAPPVNNTNAASAVVNMAYSKLGSPYVWGAEGPNTFDCSGLTSYVFRNAAGVSLPRTSGSQYGVGTSVSKANLQPGDLVFFATGGGGISHVGIYVGGGQMIHAPQTGDVVKVSNINSSYWQNAYVGAKRVL